MRVLKKFYLFWLAVILCLVPSFVQANLSIMPYNADHTNPQNKDWFIFQAKPGEVISDALILSNSQNQDYTVKILGKDAKITDNGSFTILPDQVENQEAGKWLRLDIEQIVIPANKNIKLPFKVEIPKETKDGEYGAGFGVSLLNPGQESLNIQIRKGVRTYIAVGQDFSLNAKVANLNILDPKDSDYQQVKADKQYFGKDNIILDFDAENVGNVFGVLNCKYALNYTDGTIFESTFTTDLAPRVGSRKFDIVTNQPYKIGKTQVILDCQIESQNIDLKKVKIETQKTVISDNLELNQADLDSFEMSKQPAFNQVKQNISISKAPEAENPKTPTVEQGNNYNLWIYGLVGFVLLIGISGVVYYLYFKKSQNKKA
jgi:hypothetical protein